MIYGDILSYLLMVGGSKCGPQIGLVYYAVYGFNHITDRADQGTKEVATAATSQEAGTSPTTWARHMGSNPAWS